MKKYQKRVFISFDGKCPMNCLHCFTYELEEKKNSRKNEELLQELEEKEFDIVYVSQTYENFYEEEKGIDLCKSVYKKYRKDIYIITRSRLSDNGIMELADLNAQMRQKGNRLFVAVSVCGNESYGITEDVNRCPSPNERLKNLEKLYYMGVSTILLVRPLFPDHIISVDECKKLIELSKDYIDVVISSGLIVTDKIIERLGLTEDKLKFLVDGDSEYLANLQQRQVRYLDVEQELQTLDVYCNEIHLPFFRHSLPALNFLVEQK